MGLPDDFYERIKGRLHRRICRELRSARGLLDIGCGSCELSRFLVEQNGGQVIGVDISDTGFPEEETGTGGIQCRKGDAGNIEFLKDESMDAVVSVYALHEMKNALKALKEAHRVVRRGGRILVIDFPKGSLAQQLWNERYYTRSQVASMLSQAGFVDVESIAVFRGQVIWARARKAASTPPLSVEPKDVRVEVHGRLPGLVRTPGDPTRRTLFVGTGTPLARRIPSLERSEVLA